MNECTIHETISTARMWLLTELAPGDRDFKRRATRNALAKYHWMGLRPYTKWSAK